MFVSVNGKILTNDSQSIPAVTDGLFYGAGCFETLKSYGGKFLHFQQHMNRLNAGIRFLTGSGENAVDPEAIRNEIDELLKASNLLDTDAKVRFQMSLGGRHGYNQPEHSELIRVITAEKSEHNIRYRTLKTSDVRVVPSSCKPAQYKLSNMLHYRQAGIEAKKAGADDALMLTLDGYVAETSIANLIWESNGRFYTPSISCDILPGVMRSIVIDMLESMDYPVIQGEYSQSDLMNSRQVWCTNSVMEIAQISEIDRKPFEIDTELFSSVERHLRHYKEDHLK